MKKINRTIQRKILFSVFIFLAAFAVFLLILEVLNLNKIISGLEVAGIEIGGMTTEQARTVLSDRFDNWENRGISLLYDDKEIEFLPKEAGLSLNSTDAARMAYEMGRKKNIALGLFQQTIIFFRLGQRDLSPVLTINEDVFEHYLEQKFAGAEEPAKNASLKYDAKSRNWEIVAPRDGNIFDRGQLKSDLVTRINLLDSSPIGLIMIKSYPEVLENETEEARKSTDRILEHAPFFIRYQNDEEKKNTEEKLWKIDRETLTDWIEFIPVEENGTASNKILGVSLNKDKINDTLMTIAPNINKDPVNAQLTAKDGRVTAFVLSQTGTRLEVGETAEKISRSIITFGKTQLSQEEIEKKIDVVVSKKEPQITTDGIDTLGLTALLGRGTSNFSGSPKNRVHNIKVGTARFTGILLKPGEEFSFNNILGEVGPAQGYLPELVIKKNKTTPEYGGGICQVSTTAFRAAIYSGLKVTERYPHAFPVKYYNPQGFDATIYPPRPDLKFINDTPNNLLIQAGVEGSILIFEFFGTDDGREVKVVGPTVLESKTDGSMKTILYQEVWRDGELERKDKFYSNYRSPNLYPIIRNPLE